MLLPIRPHYLFGHVTKEHEIVSLPIPTVRNSGSPTLLETFVLLAAGRIVKPKRILEIGTFRGLTTRILAMNFPAAEILTLDIDQSHAGHLPENVKQLQGHSMAIDFVTWHDSCQLVFIDGGHDYETVKADTATAALLIDTRAPSAIVWHDCGNPNCPGVAQALRESELPIFHVEESQMAVYLTPRG